MFSNIIYVLHIPHTYSISLKKKKNYTNLPRPNSFKNKLVIIGMIRMWIQASDRARRGGRGIRGHRGTWRQWLLSSHSTWGRLRQRPHAARRPRARIHLHVEYLLRIILLKEHHLLSLTTACMLVFCDNSLLCLE